MVQVLAFIYFVRSDSSQSLNYKARLFLSFDKKNRFMDDSSQKCRLYLKIIITNVKALQKRFNIHCKLLFFFIENEFGVYIRFLFVDFFHCHPFTVSICKDCTSFAIGMLLQLEVFQI